MCAHATQKLESIMKIERKAHTHFKNQHSNANNFPHTLTPLHHIHSHITGQITHQYDLAFILIVNIVWPGISINTCMKCIYSY